MGKTLVMKFGGAAVASAAHFALIAKIVRDRRADYPRIAVVVSAMGNTTNELLALAHQVNGAPARRELDMLATVGERISISLLAMALANHQIEALSFTGSQSGIITTVDHTEARIVDVRPHRLEKRLDEGKIAIVAGFQGVSLEGEITTLGRGGSDTSAVALGVGLEADEVEFYKDVRGIYAEDPKCNPEAALFPRLTYDAALEIMQRGAKVLHPRSLVLAQKNRLPLRVLSFLHPGEQKGTWVGERGERGGKIYEGG